MQTCVARAKRRSALGHHLTCGHIVSHVWFRARTRYPIIHQIVAGRLYVRGLVVELTVCNRVRERGVEPERGVLLHAGQNVRIRVERYANVRVA